MELNYDFNVKNGMFEYNCEDYSSYIKIRDKDAEKIYDIFNRLDDIEKRAKEYGTSSCICKGFEILFDFNGFIRVKNISNWLVIEKEVPIIKKELRKYIKGYNTKSVKDIIVKIKSLKKGSSNRIKEDLK